MVNYFNYIRRRSSEAQIGDTPMGGNNPVRIQSMANTSTMDTEESIAQCIRIIEAGGEYVRFTAQGVREAENLANIRDGIRGKGYTTPLIADIHFNPKAAEAAAKVVEKVRINPGNFVDSIKTFRHFEYTEEEYQRELNKIRDRFIPFLNICKEYCTAIRIGVNHGSLSDRIMSRYGDTPEGMVESCMEFLRICRDEHFHDVVISVKASNTVVMVQTVRLLVARMNREGMSYPLHLGVTEAGDGEDGRIKSAVGIGALLSDGIGDTVRVSLSEEPEAEIPVARKLADYVSERENHVPIQADVFSGFNFFSPEKRKSRPVKNIGGNHLPVVIADHSENTGEPGELLPDYLYIGTKKEIGGFPQGIPLLVDFPVWKDNKSVGFPVFSFSEKEKIKETDSPVKFLKLSYSDLSDELTDVLQSDESLVVILQTGHKNGVGEQRAFFHALLNKKCFVPVVIERTYRENDPEDLQIKSGVDFGTLLLDGFGDGVMISNKGTIPVKDIINYSFGILQAARARISKTEYISCPGCGRTLFNLQQTISQVKAATSHLTGLKIGIMGCIVNGPGEMADADYGYVGAGKGRISLYKGKECVEKNIPEEEAVEKLMHLICQYENRAGKTQG
ncbi:MAG: 4-hydroxy-3-methylbut-2-en-1-yl diphosphate synthase [Candidatus Azobacteroides sp.]|nr:4-hydroxy-3-methylbut-2-en-1-yl diphosphate synthase [Candidatus Azobacteroides sp.]